MLATGLIISSHYSPRAGVARQTWRARAKRRAAELYALSRELGTQPRQVNELGRILRRHALAGIDGDSAVLMPDAERPAAGSGRLFARSGSEARYPVPGNDLGIAQWAYDHRQKAGHGTETLASANAIFLPLNAQQRCIGVLAVRPNDTHQLDVPRTDAP